MTIKELCTKVREAAERTRPIWMWRERGDHGRWHYTDVPPDDADRHWNETHELQPAVVSKEDVLALLGRIEELEKALEPFVTILEVSEANAVKSKRDPSAVSDDFDVLAFRDVPGLKLRAFRNARAALSGETP